MNKATANLENDHLYILRLIDVMEQMVMNLATDLTDMELVVSVIINFADGFHHAKEESLLFPLLIKKGFSSEIGPVSVMLHEHEEGRKYVKGMIDGIEKCLSGNESAFPDIYMNMQGYIDLLRAHIGKENNVLFKMADKVIDSTEQQELMNKFEELEATNYANGQIDRLILDIEGLEATYLNKS